MCSSDLRICLSCYLEMVGSYPLPFNAPPSLGGAFADAQKLAKSAKEAASQKRDEVMEEVSRTIAAEAGGFQQGVSDIKKDLREKREAFWKEMPDEVQEYRKDLNKKVNEGIDDGKAAAHGAVDWAKQKADSVFDDLNNLF